MVDTTGARTRRQRFRVIAAVAAVALLASACGDDTDDEAEEDTTTQDSSGTDDASATDEAAEDGASEATGDPVTIAVLSDETGPTTARAADVLQAAADDINANGGLNGHPIELVTTDVASDVGKAQAAVADLPDDVIAVLLSSPSTEGSIADALNDLGVPILGQGYNPAVWGGDLTIFQAECSDENPDNCARTNFLTTSTTIEGIIAAQLAGAVNVDASNVLQASCAEVDSCSASEPIFTAIGESLGLTVVPSVKVSSTAPDYSAECIGFVQDEIDYVQVGASATVATNLVDSCRDQGYEGSYGASGGSVTSDVLATGAPFAGGINGFPWFVDDPQVTEYREIMEGAGVAEADWGFPVGTGMYANLHLLQEALTDYADPEAPLDGAAALEAMFQVTDEDLDGLLATPVTFSPDELDRSRNCYWPYVQDADGNIDNPLGGLATECFPAE